MKRPKNGLLLTSLSSILLLAGGGEQGPESFDGKGDMIGDRSADSACTFDVQCKQDLGHVCRPAPDGAAARCGLPHDNNGPCVEDADCYSDNCGDNVCQAKGIPAGGAARGMRCGTDLGWCWATVPGVPGTYCSCFGHNGASVPGQLF